LPVFEHHKCGDGGVRASQGNGDQSWKGVGGPIVRLNLHGFFARYRRINWFYPAADANRRVPQSNRFDPRSQLRNGQEKLSDIEGVPLR
jgi:hypothetical protein